MEAGNRCFDWRVPEEKNRKLIDHISDVAAAVHAALARVPAREGIHPSDRIFVTGNPITEMLEQFRPRWEASDVLERLELEPDGYVLVTRTARRP